jgi:hypothetical protein
VTWLRAWISPHVVWWHTPNEGKRDEAQAHVRHLLGVRPGVSDFVFIGSGGLAHLLELKAYNRQPTEAQKEFLNDCFRLGCPIDCRGSIFEATETVIRWGFIPDPEQARRHVPNPLNVQFKKRAESTLKARRTFAQPYD